MPGRRHDFADDPVLLRIVVGPIGHVVLDGASVVVLGLVEIGFSGAVLVHRVAALPEADEALVLLGDAALRPRFDEEDWQRVMGLHLEDVKQRVQAIQDQIMRIPTLTDTMTLAGIGFGVMGFSHFLADIISPWLLANYPGLAAYQLTSPFFWLVVVSTTIGLVLSTTKARDLEGVGASRVGSALLYVLVATIGMRMNLRAIAENFELFVVGLIWLGFHAVLLIVVAKIIRAPFFFLAVGSQANVGGAYYVNVSANDGNGGTTAQLLNVTVTDANDAPVITSGAAPSVPENTTAVTTTMVMPPTSSMPGWKKPLSLAGSVLTANWKS